jgi:putative flippase GtrA
MIDKNHELNILVTTLIPILVVSMFTNNFVKYFIIGVFATILSTTILIILVDYIHIWIGYANPITISIIYIRQDK